MREPAIRLRTARKLAGFKSARAAALAFAWPESLYAAHESGSRRPSSKQMARYLEAFAVDPNELLRAERYGIRPSVDSQAKRDEKQQRARRLTLARILAGFTTAKLAANMYDFNEQNYYAHESGRHGVSEQLAPVYALAFGVSAHWLQNGDGPSGLPTDPSVEAMVDAFVQSNGDYIPEQLTQFVSTTRRASPAAVARLRARERPSTALPMATTTAGGALEIVREGVGEGRSKVWGFPAGFLTNTWGLSPASLRVLTLSPDSSSATTSADDRILIDLADVSFVEGAEFVVRSRDGSLKIVTSPPTGPAEIETLGRVVARISRVP